MIPDCLHNHKSTSMPANKKVLKVYYSHPISTYRTEKERISLSLINRKFPDAVVINPDSYESQSMNDYFELLSTCDALAYHENEHSRITKGVMSELWIAEELDKPIYHITTHEITSKKIPVLTVSSKEYRIIESFLSKREE